MRRLLHLYVIISALVLAVSDHRLIIYLGALFSYYILLIRRVRFRSFVLPFIVIEETIAYYLGGGLHGEAHSLIHDRVRSVPIFLVHFYLRSRYTIKSGCEIDKIVLSAGLHGAFREVIVPRAFSLGSLFIAGIAIFIYGFPLYSLEPRGDRCSLLRPRVTILAAELIVGILLAMLFPR